MSATGVLVVLVALAGSPVAPRFEDYPATESQSGPAAAPNLASHPEARTYRTVLRRGAKTGPDFAGKFTLVRIGCGTSCAQIAVVDAKDGSVYFPKGLGIVQWAGWWHEPYGIQYRPSSRLAVVYGVANEEESVGRYGVSYFLWNGQDFELLLFEPRDRGRPPK